MKMMRRRFFQILTTPAVTSLLEAYEHARPGYSYSFPRDHFAHPNFQTEWWYYTGNLLASNQHRFGFELTFFRVGVEQEKPIDSPWNFGQLYLAHLALSDIEAGQFYHAERFQRGGPGLAGVSEQQGRIWNGNWSAAWLDLLSTSKPQLLSGVTDRFSIDLHLESVKLPVVHGENGVMWKSDNGTNGSHYTSFTRLSAQGRVNVDGTLTEVRGTAWMDHEFFSQGMGLGQIGWDWMSIQLVDQTELMLYRIRSRTDSGQSFFAGTFVDVIGRVKHLDPVDIVMTPGNTWTSELTGAQYPVEWEIGIRSLELELKCHTPMASQEIVTERGIGPNYWEGAVVYEGIKARDKISGVGYLEMTGYDRPVQLNVLAPR